MKLTGKLAFGVAVLLTGCTSMTTTLLNRQDDDSFTRNERCPNRGIPITVLVPTHVKIWIEEEYYIQNQGEKLAPLYLDKPVLSVRTEYDYEEKLFTVDFKRPMSGTIQTDIKIDAQKQYFERIHGKVVDNTIRDITGIIQQFAPAFRKGKATAAGETLMANLIVAKRTVAFGRFDLNAPDYAARISQFLDAHINNCGYCGEFDGQTRSPSPNPSAPQTNTLRPVPRTEER